MVKKIKCFGHGTVCFLPEFLECEAKTGPYQKIVKKIKCFGHGTVCMRWMGLKLCTRDSWCKNWPTRELVHQAYSLPEFLDLWSKDWLLLKMVKKIKCFGHGTVCMHWMGLELCTRDSWCKNWPTRELVHQAYSLPEFLDLHGTVCMRWMGLELCTRDSWCKNWPTRELVHQAYSLPEFLDLWSKDWFSLKMVKKIECFGHGTVCMHWMGLELCTRDSWCKNWPKRELVHQVYFLPEFLDLWVCACVEWIVNYAQDVAVVRTDPQRSWSRKQILFLSFLIREANYCPIEILPCIPTPDFTDSDHQFSRSYDKNKPCIFDHIPFVSLLPF